jgi:serine protease AprX
MMANKNLPIKIVLPKETDRQRNNGGGETKFFGDVTPELQTSVAGMFEHVLDYYKDVFSANNMIPAVGKITVKQEAIAKSHKPNELCQKCPIIGSEELHEIYIRVDKKSIIETIELIKKPPSKRFKANLTAIEDIKPVTTREKISKNLEEVLTQGGFDKIKGRIKLKLFDFSDDFDNSQIEGYVMSKLHDFGLSEKYEIILYGSKIKLIKIEVNSNDDIINLASINGVRAVDFFQEYSLPLDEFNDVDLQDFLGGEYSESEIRIGIIDGGISKNNALLQPYVVAREEYISEAYRNPNHATFIASTIQYGNKLNGIETTSSLRFKFVDIVAMPNGDKNYGAVDTIGEKELMEIIEEVMDKYASTTKIWNLSIGIEDRVCSGVISDLGIFLDYIQDKYQVQIFVSSGNLNQPPFREWPPQGTIGERDRIVSPADSIRSITVGSLALCESDNSIVRKDEPSPFSRRGPGANYTIKPDVVDYGGNLSNSNQIQGLGIKGLDSRGRVIEGIGTSYSTPRIAQKFASIYDEMAEKDLLLTKAMLIHSARMNSRNLLDHNHDNMKYYGFGMPSVEAQEILHCNDIGDEITLVFRQKVVQGTHLEMYDFPYPSSLMHNGKCYGEIVMTLAYNPILDENHGREYCRTNIDVSFGIYKYLKPGELKYKGCVPIESSWDEKFEKSRVEHGFKWSPIKSYYRKISNKGIDAWDGWKVRIDMYPRNNLFVNAQEFVLIITIKDPVGKNDIYTEVVNGLKTRGYNTVNLETRQQIRQRQ